MKYPDIPSAIRPVAHCDEIPVPVFAGLNEINDDVISTTTSNTDEDEPTDVFQPSDADCDMPFLFSQAELNDLERNLYLSKMSAELLASRLKEKGMLEPGSSVSFYRKRSRTVE